MPSTLRSEDNFTTTRHVDGVVASVMWSQDTGTINTYNVSSYTDLGTGKSRITFTQAILVGSRAITVSGSKALVDTQCKHLNLHGDTETDEYVDMYNWNMNPALRDVIWGCISVRRAAV